MDMRVWMATAMLVAGATGPSYADDMATLDQKVSYVVGFQIGQQLKNEGIPVDDNALLMAIKDAMTGQTPRLTREEVQTVMTTFGEQRQEALAKRAQQSLAEGKSYLDQNKTKPGVKSTASGLQYKVMTEGKGAKPKAMDTVTVNYRGTLIDGTEFDSSYKRGEPATFPVNGVIQGWQEALQLMPLGSKWQLVIPAELAYGERGAGGDIGPNSTLVFEVELLKINPAN